MFIGLLEGFDASCTRLKKRENETGGQGVAGSNPAIPTISQCYLLLRKDMLWADPTDQPFRLHRCRPTNNAIAEFDPLFRSALFQRAKIVGVRAGRITFCTTRLNVFVRVPTDHFSRVSYKLSRRQPCGSRRPEKGA
jgi:hypothetical protein